MWTLLFILGGAFAVMALMHDPKIDEEHKKFYNKYY